MLSTEVLRKRTEDKSLYNFYLNLLENGDRKLLTKHHTAYDRLALTLRVISKGPCSITDLFHEIKSSYTLVKESADIALRFKLAKRRPSQTEYHITSKGLEFLEVWKKLQNLLTEIKEVPDS